MLGNTVADPLGIEGIPDSVEGLGLLDVSTTMAEEKSVRQVRGHCARSKIPVYGYEIHIGTTKGADTTRSLFNLDGVDDGATSANGLVEGTYLHGLFASDAFRSSWLDSIRAGVSSDTNYEAQLDRDIDALASQLEVSLDIDALLDDAQLAYLT